MKYLLILTIISPICLSVSDWRPVLQPELYPGLKGHYQSQSSYPSLSSLVVQNYQQPSGSHDNLGGQCELYKVGFTQDLYFQYIQYKASLPELKEFTLCYWSKFTNHSNDHPIFSYAVDGQPKAILAWVSNTDRSSYFSLAVEGHTFYRLNYPLRLNRWYHTCQSWNGKTGEWQIWVNGERVGRGFHNRLVGHLIPAGGIAITGQEQTQVGGGFLEGDEAPKGAGGMLGEITMVQLYKVALTAGKAYKDHKHHHAHRFDHNGFPITTTPRPQRPARPMTPTHPLLTGGQLNPNIALNIASLQTQQQLTPQLVPGQMFGAQLLNGQFVNTLVQQQFMNTPQSRSPQQFLPQGNQPPPSPQPIPEQALQIYPQQIQSQPLPSNPSTFINNGLAQQATLINPTDIQITQAQLETHQLFKRDNMEETIDPVLADIESNTNKKQTKRGLIFQGGAIIEDPSVGNTFDQSLLNGLAGIGQNQPIMQLQQQNEEKEPAEAEVRAVLKLCSGCDEEPFDKALIFGWRTVTKKLYSGAFYTPAVPRCKAF